MMKTDSADNKSLKDGFEEFMRHCTIKDYSRSTLDNYDDLANMDLDELTAFIAHKGKNRFDNPENVAKAAQTAARSSY